MTNSPKARRWKKFCAKRQKRASYEAVHHINATDYTTAQLNAWATGQVNLDEWHRSLLAHDTIVATANGIIVGFGDMDETGYLDRLFVHKDYQHQGIATAICDALQARSKQKHITAQGFFAQRGYYVIQELTIQRNGIPLTTMLTEKS